MSTGRFAALLGVVLVIGVAGVAQGASGDPLILGQENTSDLPTGLNGEIGIKSAGIGRLSITQLEPPGRLVKFAAGAQTHTLAAQTGNLVVCTSQTKGNTVAYARVNAAGDQLTVGLTAPATTDVVVACLQFTKFR